MFDESKSLPFNVVESKKEP